MLLFQLEAQMPYCHVILLPNISKVFIVYKGLRMSSHGICSYTCRNSTVSHEYVDFMMNLSTSTICKFFMGVCIDRSLARRQNPEPWKRIMGRRQWRHMGRLCYYTKCKCFCRL
ncbi:hypothetical protein BDE02_11G032100 [Populus trichocarpa]|nr:hypothetical protein BDE02_11G032100 [Populus trichocarpa]